MANAQSVLAMIKAKDVKFVDLRFTDPRGKWQHVTFDLSLFEAVARGYLREAGAFLTKKEVELLPASVKVITFELGIRFLADYLRGDTYFKIKHPTHNLHRARVQFRLLERIEAEEVRISSFITAVQSGG